MAFCLFLETAFAGQCLPKHRLSLSSRTRRQTADDIHFNRVFGRVQYSTRCIQNNINAISKCGTEVSTITAIELSCRKTERGLICSEAWAYVDGNCTGSTCTAGCSNSLMLAGCCANGGTARQISNLATCKYTTSFTHESVTTKLVQT